MKRIRTIQGVSTLELAVVLCVVAILSAAFGRAIYATTETARRDAVLDQLDRLKKGLVGDPRTIPPGETDVRRYGYIGDIGNLPPTGASGLSYLIENTATQNLPSFIIHPTLQLGAGWRGPYIPASQANFTIDPWGNPIVWEKLPAGSFSSKTGSPVYATLRSNGPDGQDNNGAGDDAIVEIYKSEVLSEVIGYVKDAYGQTMPGVAVSLFAPSSGVIPVVTPFATTTDPNGLYKFTDVPQGERVLQLSPKLTFVRDTAFTSNVDRNDVEFVVENLAKDITPSLTSMTLIYDSQPVSDFTDVLINGTSVFSGLRSSNVSIPFSSPKTAAGTNVLQEPIQFFQASGLIMLVPDAIIGTLGTGGTLKVEVRNFEAVGTNDNVDMTGVTFTVKFSDGAAYSSETIFKTKRKP